MCLVGPPGVGKTSLAQSIARALNKKFVKMSLGGVKDESEIRGHRKTYLGSLPGRIIQGMKKAETINPLFLLDEIDKMSSDYRGDPTSAMLEVLDPEQNKIFSDNYIEEDYDLSKVMFVATANYYEQIPEPLIDRMEIIEISSYTSLEKLQIAKNHLVPKVLTDCGLNKKEISFSDSSLSYIINFYTRESGVRELERLISKIARKFIVKQSKKEITKIKIDEKIVKEYLGKEIFELTEKDKVSIPGVVNGMAYTTAGGDLLPIEVSLFPGKGNIIVTGNLKETMKESASVALGFVRSNYKTFNIDSDIFKDNDFHIHVPQGGVPKDGPSAGVALTSAIISAIKKHKVSTKISMTGEITLRGKVLTIGGLKEKIISAHRGGVREIFIPYTNERHLEDVPKEIIKDIKVNLINNYEEIFDKLFIK
jgi:ATP-dependent Lon protease